MILAKSAKTTQGLSIIPQYILHNIHYANKTDSQGGTVGGIKTHFTYPLFPVRVLFDLASGLRGTVLVIPYLFPNLVIAIQASNLWKCPPILACRRIGLLGKLYRLFRPKTPENAPKSGFCAKSLNIPLFLTFGGCHE